jgi:hypothetical protein
MITNQNPVVAAAISAYEPQGPNFQYLTQLQLESLSPFIDGAVSFEIWPERPGNWDLGALNLEAL